MILGPEDAHEQGFVRSSGFSIEENGGCAPLVCTAAAGRISFLTRKIGESPPVLRAKSTRSAAVGRSNMILGPEDDVRIPQTAGFDTPKILVTSSILHGRQ
jgi:hypothetical protein